MTIPRRALVFLQDDMGLYHVLELDHVSADVDFEQTLRDVTSDGSLGSMADVTNRFLRGPKQWDLHIRGQGKLMTFDSLDSWVAWKSKQPRDYPEQTRLPLEP